MGLNNSFQKYLFPDVISLNPKQKFLKNLSRITKKYKRYFASSLKYSGIKSPAVVFTIEKIPENINKLIFSLFGSASIEMAVAKEFKIINLGFDVLVILISGNSNRKS